MPRSKEMDLKYRHCKEMYLDGSRDFETMGALFSVAPKTIKKWARENKWDDEVDEIYTLEKEIERNSMLALKAGLKAYVDDPNNTSLQSLVVLLKDFQNKKKPAKELHEYIVKFLDQTVTYYHSQNMLDLASQFQESIYGLAEFLRVQNNG